MVDKKYFCELCGSLMEFDIAAQKLKCCSCGNEIDIIDDKSKIVEHPLTAASMKRIKPENKASQTMECPSCGARIEVEATCTATSCPYCGSNYVLAEKQEAVVIPDGVIPFRITKEQVGEIFRNWIQHRLLAPSVLKTLFQQGKLQGVYLPFWTFDAKVDAYYTAQGGKTRVETYKDKDGNTHNRTRTDWYFTSGYVHEFFDDIVVRASEKLDTHLLSRIQPFDTHDVNSYSPDYFSGFEAECCSRPLDDAHTEARATMQQQLIELARRDVLRRFDSVKDVHIRPTYSDETYKHVIAPVYSTAYDFKGKQYTVLVNGQTGKIQGGYPKSPAKIALICAIIAVIIILITMGITKNEENEYAILPDSVNPVVEYQEDEIVMDVAEQFDSYVYEEI